MTPHQVLRVRGGRSGRPPSRAAERYGFRSWLRFDPGAAHVPTEEELDEAADNFNNTVGSNEPIEEE